MAWCLRIKFSCFCLIREVETFLTFTSEQVLLGLRAGLCLVIKLLTIYLRLVGTAAADREPVIDILLSFSFYIPERLRELLVML